MRQRLKVRVRYYSFPRRQRQREKHRETERQTDRQAGRQAHTHARTHTLTHACTQTHTHTGKKNNLPRTEHVDGDLDLVAAQAVVGLALELGVVGDGRAGDGEGGAAGDAG